MLGYQGAIFVPWIELREGWLLLPIRQSQEGCCGNKFGVDGRAVLRQRRSPPKHFTFRHASMIAILVVDRDCLKF